MRVLSGQTRCQSRGRCSRSSSPLLSHSAACAGEGCRHSPFGVLEREGFVPSTRLETAEHEALFARPEETITDASGAAARPSTPADGRLRRTGPAGGPRGCCSPGNHRTFHPRLSASHDRRCGVRTTCRPRPIQPWCPIIPPPCISHASLLEQELFPAGLPQRQAARLKARARELLANGSVASARALLEGAASGGDAESEYLLAQTYDPATLSRSGVIGIAGDAGKADALYRAAQLGGYPRPDENASAAQR